MAGSRQSEAGSRVFHIGPTSGGPVFADEICLDRRYVDGACVVPKAKQNLDEKLESIIDGEIIPRLMLLHGDAADKMNQAEPVLPDEEIAVHVDELAKLVISAETDVIIAYIKVLRKKGTDLETLFLKLFAPAARKLGQMWETDEIDFVDVTVGTAKLQQLLHHFSLPRRSDPAKPGRRVLLLPTPSEQHTFGLLMVGDFFRKYGWDVTCGAPISTERFPSAVADQWFALIGFSLSCERLIGLLGETIETVRRASKNQGVQIVVGGRIFAENKSLGETLGADMVVADAREAVELAEGVLRVSESRRD